MKVGLESSLVRRFRFILLSKEASMVDGHGQVCEGKATFPVGTFSLRPPEVQGRRNMPCDPLVNRGRGPYRGSDNHGTVKNMEEDSEKVLRM